MTEEQQQQQQQSEIATGLEQQLAMLEVERAALDTQHRLLSEALYKLAVEDAFLEKQQFAAVRAHQMQQQQQQQPQPPQPPQQRRTERIGPSPLLEKVRAFLPELGRANVELQSRIAREGRGAVDIELPQDAPETAPHVAFNLFLAREDSDDSSDSSRDDDDEEEEEEEERAPAAAPAPKIEDLGEQL